MFFWLLFFFSAYVIFSVPLHLRLIRVQLNPLKVSWERGEKLHFIQHSEWQNSHSLFFLGLFSHLGSHFSTFCIDVCSQRVIGATCSIRGMAAISIHNGVEDYWPVHTSIHGAINCRAHISLSVSQGRASQSQQPLVQRAAPWTVHQSITGTHVEPTPPTLIFMVYLEHGCQTQFGSRAAYNTIMMMSSGPDQYEHNIINNRSMFFPLCFHEKKHKYIGYLLLLIYM